MKLCKKNKKINSGTNFSYDYLVYFQNEIVSINENRHDS